MYLIDLLKAEKRNRQLSRKEMKEKKKQKIYLLLSGTDIEEKKEKIFHKNTNYKDLKNTQKGGNKLWVQ